MPGKLRVGTSGWIYRHWSGVFYPPNLAQSGWFGYYASEFDTVEINNTFYRLPAETVFDRWREQAPAGFVYAVKASRYLTHIKRLANAAKPLELILSRARRLGDHLGPILYQLPPHWHADPTRLGQFAEILPPDLHHVFEFRDPDWYREEIREVLARYRLALCQVDLGGLHSPTWVTAPIVYIRFHGTAWYEGRYSLEELSVWAERIRSYLADDRDVYAYFNNDAFGHAVTNAQELRALIDQRQTP